MTQPSEWYDDPQDPSKLRYWDGVIWTDHVTPKQAPTLEQSTIGMAQPPTWGETATGGDRPAYPGPAPMPTWQQGYVTPQATTPDGVPLSGWWKRVLARVLDGIFTFFIGLPLTGYFIYRYFQAVIDYADKQVQQARSGAQPSPFALPTELYAWVIPVALLSVLVAVVYEYLFLTHSGATWGKKIVGISVRLRETPGPLPSSAAWRRIGVINGLQLLSLIPIVGNLASIAELLNYLWPLWDPNKQAWHDKAAKTNVVVGPQPKR